MNVHNIPPLLANAVIKKPDEPNVDTFDNASDRNRKSQSESSQSCDSNDSNGEPIGECASSSSSSPQMERSQSQDQYPSMANFLPENSYFYNDKNCYIFPGAEIWWSKDSDLESTSSDSDDDDDDDDIDDMAEIATMEQNEMIGGDVESTLAVENLLETTNEHEFNKYLLKRNANTSLEHIHIDEGGMHDLNAKRLKGIESELALNDDQHHDDQTSCSTMCETTLDNSNSSNINSNISGSNSSSSSSSLTSQQQEQQQQHLLPPPPPPPPLSPTILSNEVFSPKL